MQKYLKVTVELFALEDSRPDRRSCLMALSQAKKERLALYATLLSVFYLLCAGSLKVYAPERNSRIFAALSGSEPFHIFAHTLLYGSLAVLLFFVFSSRILAVLIVFLVGLAQESVQIFFCERGLSWPEFFDLAVDVTAATLSLLALDYWRRKRKVSEIKGS